MDASGVVVSTRKRKATTGGKPRGASKKTDPNSEKLARYMVIMRAECLAQSNLMYGSDKRLVPIQSTHMAYRDKLSLSTVGYITFVQMFNTVSKRPEGDPFIVKVFDRSTICTIPCQDVNKRLTRHIDGYVLQVIDPTPSLSKYFMKPVIDCNLNSTPVTLPANSYESLPFTDQDSVYGRHITRLAFPPNEDYNLGTFHTLSSASLTFSPAQKKELSRQLCDFVFRMLERRSATHEFVEAYFVVFLKDGINRTMLFTSQEHMPKLFFTCYHRVVSYNCSSRVISNTETFNIQNRPINILCSYIGHLDKNRLAQPINAPPVRVEMLSENAPGAIKHRLVPKGFEEIPASSDIKEYCRDTKLRRSNHIGRTVANKIVGLILLLRNIMQGYQSFSLEMDSKHAVACMEGENMPPCACNVISMTLCGNNRALFDGIHKLLCVEIVPKLLAATSTADVVDVGTQHFAALEEMVLKIVNVATR